MTALVDTLKEVFHHIGFHNCYNSAAFCRASSNCPLKLLVDGIIWKGGCDIPYCVQQQKEEDQKAVYSL